MRRDARVVTRAVADAEADEDGKPRARLVRGADGKFVREGSEGGGDAGAADAAARAAADAAADAAGEADEGVEGVVAVRRGNRVNETRTVVAAVMVAVVAVVGGKDGILGTPTPSRAGDASARVEAEGDKISGSKTVEKVDAVSLDVK